MAKYVYNRAVGAHNKGDTFEADPEQPFVQSLLGAGYAEPVLDTGEDEEAAARVYEEDPGPVTEVKE